MDCGGNRLRRGTHLTAKILQGVLAALGIQWDQHKSWHPQSSGQVERKNEWGNKETPLEAGDRNQDGTGTTFAIGFGKDKSQTQGRYSMISLGIGVWNSLPW